MQQQVKDIAHLRELLLDGKRDFFISLGGVLRSSKDLALLDDGRFFIFHSIDGHAESLTETELLTETNIGIALERGAFYTHD